MSFCGSNFSLIDGQSTMTHHGATIRQVGNVELSEHLGAGEFGTVWNACDPKLDWVGAGKVPRKEQLAPSETEQFLREVGAAGQIHHSRIVSVHKVGVPRHKACVKELASCRAN